MFVFLCLCFCLFRLSLFWCFYLLADEILDVAHELDGEDADIGPSEQNFNGGILVDARVVLSNIGVSVLNLAEQSMAWKAANHNGWPPFNALVFLGTRTAWQRINRESLAK